MAAEKKTSPNVESRLRHNILKMPQEVYAASGIVINGRRLKSFVFTTDLAIIRNCDADAVFAVYPFTPQQATFRMDAPESMRLWMLVSSFVTVMMTGISTTRETASRFRSEMGELSTTPMAPWLSTSRARFRVRTPWVVPPPTPQNTGM